MILAINGDSLPRQCRPGAGESDSYLVRRKDSVLAFNIARLGMADLIARAAWPHRPGDTPASGAVTGKAIPSRFYLSGLVLKRDGAKAVVDHVIPESPAAKAGIHSGDSLIAESADSLRELEGSDHSEALSFRLIRRGSSRQIVLRSKFAGEILAALSNQNPNTTVPASTSPEE